MKTRSLLSIGLATLLFIPPSVGQGRGAGQGQGRQGQGPPFGGNPATGARAQLRGTPQQQQHYRVCQQAIHRLRKRLRAMANLASLEALQAQQLKQLHDQLVNDLHSVEQDQRAFADSLTAEQRGTYQAALAKMAQSQQDLELFSDALGFELDHAALEKEMVRKNLQNLDATSRRLEKQQQNLAEQLNVD